MGNTGSKLPAEARLLSSRATATGTALTFVTGRDALNETLREMSVPNRLLHFEFLSRVFSVIECDSVNPSNINEKQEVFLKFIQIRSQPIFKHGH